ncbi:MAG: uracil-DNA glycosylase [Oscillospiraceae bacterium]
MNLDSLRDECLVCTKCALCHTRTNVVFGTGSDVASVMFIGEAPGKNEDQAGEPFVGRAGQLLDLYLTAVGMKRGDVFIANIIKCRPPDNRDPLPSEQTACIGYLREQIRLINPKLVVCLGRISAKQIISADFQVTKDHGKVFVKDSVSYMGTFHPAALLRNPNYKPDALLDFKEIARLASV